MALAPAALGIVLSNRNQQILLIKRADVPVWVLPGGGIEDHESPEHAVVREIQEETGFQTSVVRHCATYHPINRLASETYIYKCQILDGHLLTSSESVEVQFFSFDSLPQNFFHIHNRWLTENLSSNQFIERDLTEINFLNLFLFFCKHPLQVLKYMWTRFKCR